MHDMALQLMDMALHRFDNWSSRKPSVLDVGALDINGTFRPLIEGRSWQYTGLDLIDGPNVDVVSHDPYLYPFWPGSFDAVISGNAAHNVERPWRWLPELARVLKPGGLLVIVTVWKWGLNSYPKDYFRFMPDGLRILFEDTGVLTNYTFELCEDGTIMGSAVKR